MRKTKTITRERYMSQFIRAVRWRLPPQESEDAIADYRELIFQEERDEGRLVEELGDPVQAAHLLTDVNTYRRWLKVFTVLTLGQLLLAGWIWTGLPFVRFSSWDYGYYGESWRGIAVMAAGLVLSLYWFRRHGQKCGLLSKRLVLALAAVLLFTAGTMCLAWRQIDPQALESYTATLETTGIIPWPVILLRELVIDGGTVCALAALAGLMLAKCYDRRWLSLYILALTASVLLLILENWMLSMDLSVIENTRAALFRRLVPVAAAGLAGTGVALC